MNKMIERCKQGDMEGFGLLFETYGRTIHQTAFLITRNNSLAEDITQETMIHLFSNIRHYKEEYPFENWLFRVTVNVTKNALRKQKRDFRMEEDVFLTLQQCNRQQHTGCDLSAKRKQDRDVRANCKAAL